MPEAGWLVLLAGACLLLAAVLLLRDGTRRQRSQAGMRRVEEILARQDNSPFQAEFPATGGWLPALFDRVLQRAGMTGSPRIYAALLLPALPLFLLAEIFLGLAYALPLTTLIYPLLLYIFLQFRIARYRTQLIGQLPAFLESISRILSVGCSLELAFRNATEECDDPLQSVCRQVVKRTQAGQSLEEAMLQVADIQAIRELGFVASVFHLGMRYGGNAHAVLERLSVTMRERLRSHQELRAMTAETRTSAAILSALPVLVGLLTLSSNPRYLTGMWFDPSGRMLLLAALVLQLVGMALLFRMSRIK